MIDATTKRPRWRRRLDTALWTKFGAKSLLPTVRGPEVERKDRKAAIVPGIVGLAHNLGMGVRAEGVETREQARELTLLDCAEAQGYLYSRSVPKDQAAEQIVLRILCD